MANSLHIIRHPALTRAFSLGVAASLLALAPTGMAQDTTNASDIPEEKSSIGALDILPEGSILRRVRLPRYDVDFNPISLLTAETLTVLDEERIDGLGLTFQIYDEDGKMKARTKMRHAIYNQKLATLHASEAVFIQGQGFIVSGTGMVCDLKQSRNRIFVIGPVSSKFTRTTPNKSTAMQPKHFLTPRAIAGSIITLTGLSTSLVAVPAKHLTDAQLAELDQLNQPLKHLIEVEREKITTTLEEDAQLDAKANASMRPYLKRIGQASLLVQANTPATEPKPPVADPAKKPADPKAPKAPKVETLKVDCDGGLYFDSDTGILAYLKNVRLTEPRFRLTCSDELKVFLDKKPAKPAKPAAAKPAEPAAAKPATPAANEAMPVSPKPDAAKAVAKKDGGSLSSFGDLKRIIATGNVKVTRKNEQGKLFIATAQSASYDAKTGEMILRGGLPRLQMAANQFLQSRTPGAYIRILKNGKLTTSKGQWTMETPVKQAP